MNTDKFLTTQEVADRLRVTRFVVALWARQGRLKAYRAGHRWLIKASDLAAFIGPLRSGQR